MKKLNSWLIMMLIVIIMILPVQGFSVGTLVQTVERWPFSNRDNDVYMVTLTWTAGAGGVFTSAATDAQVTGVIRGRYIIMVITDPGATAPQAAYDITLTDPDGIDVMGGTLADRSATATEIARPLPDPTKYCGFISGALTLNISNNNVAGATGVIKIFVSK